MRRLAIFMDSIIIARLRGIISAVRVGLGKSVCHGLSEDISDVWHGWMERKCDLERSQLTGIAFEKQHKFSLPGVLL